MSIQGILQQLADMSDSAIDEEIAGLEGQLELLKLIRKKRKPVDESRPKTTGRNYDECTIDKVLAVLTATGPGTSMSIRGQLPNCHHLSVIRCIDEAVERGVISRSGKGVLTLAR